MKGHVHVVGDKGGDEELFVPIGVGLRSQHRCGHGCGIHRNGSAIGPRMMTPLAKGEPVPSPVGAWLIQPATQARVRAVAGLCIDEFEKLQMPFFPLPGWKERARDEAIEQWSKSREALLAGSQPHALLVAERVAADSGRSFEGVDDGPLGFAEVGFLPAPPEPNEKMDSEKPGQTVSEVYAASKAAEAATETLELFPYLANLAVRAGARRRGLGKELVAACERKAAEFGFDRMYIKVERSNIAARRLYDQAGYRLVYLQPAGWTRKQGPTDSNLFLRKDGLRRS